MRIAGVNFGAFDISQASSSKHTDRALANDQNCLAGGDARLADGFQARVHGSTNVASSKLTSAGSAIMPRSTIQGIARTYSAKPPPLGSNPAVRPVFL